LTDKMIKKLTKELNDLIIDNDNLF
jgi:hypothetical protein